MRIQFSNQFRKQFRKLRLGEQNRFWEKLELFKQDPHNRQLRNHALVGKYSGLRSINVGGDLRALYRQIGDDIVLYELVGTHSQLYG